MVSSLIFMLGFRLGPNRSLYAVRAAIGAGIVLVAVVVSVAGGCARAGQAPGVAGYSEPAEGLWADVDAAVAYAAPRAGLTVLRTTFEPEGALGAAEADAVVYELLSVLDRRVLLRATRAGTTPEPGRPRSGLPRAAVGAIEAEWRPFRDERLERALVQAVRDRLDSLRASSGPTPDR